jgi:hypothetical protein
MAKKTRKQSRTRVNQQQASRIVQSTVSAKPVTPVKTASAAVDLTQEYGYVFADLRKIAVIAAAMFALLFILAFALR